MRDYLGSGAVSRGKQGGNLTYILEDEGQFSQLGYKFLLSQEGKGLLPCAKIRYNGQLKFIYFAEEFQSISTVFSQSNFEGVCTILYRFVKELINVRDNGFLQYENIDIMPDAVMVDSRTLEVKLAYLPLAAGDGERVDFESLLREQMISWVKKYAEKLSPEKTDELSDLLTDRQSGLEGLLKALMKKIDIPGGPGNQRKLLLKSRDQRFPVRFLVEKESFWLGRREDNDGVVNMSKKIGRRHCRLVREQNHFYVVDEGSANGTYVNGRKVGSEKVELHDRDVLRLPDIEFSVNIK